ncbi:BlaI/MecI/CopY family transcriptional regulator [Microlunatus parietis]|uniref:Putative transcriptional regulator n=1 Tax=Microlunatus parietis TaxID=682979 RepID=A0A7Y9LGC9_9ACTN|nr:BlaI/MecI/CopY family transcriptional regulator [Microlunatus parietis]NYE75046.1 putative transcriptional regulator [Microlunatus parietis]
MVRDRGELEAKVMAALWRHDRPLTAREIQAAIGDPTPAITTVLTILERLRTKGRVLREETTGSTYRFTAAKSESEDAVEKMLTSLTATEDRAAALVQLAGNLDARDADTLRRALEARRKRGARS